jgi:hypothetical protein
VLHIGHDEDSPQSSSLKLRDNRHAVEDNSPSLFLVPKIRRGWVLRIPVTRVVHGRVGRYGGGRLGGNNMAQEYADGAVPPIGLHGSTGLERVRLDVRAWDDGAEDPQAELATLGQSVDELGEVRAERGIRSRGQRQMDAAHGGGLTLSLEALSSGCEKAASSMATEDSRSDMVRGRT